MRLCNEIGQQSWIISLKNIKEHGNYNRRKIVTELYSHSLPHPDTLRGTVIHEIFGNTIDKIKEKIKGKDVYLIVDETTDPSYRYCTMSWLAS